MRHVRPRDSTSIPYALQVIRHQSSVGERHQSRGGGGLDRVQQTRFPPLTWIGWFVASAQLAMPSVDSDSTRKRKAGRSCLQWMSKNARTPTHAAYREFFRAREQSTGSSSEINRRSSGMEPEQRFDKPRRPAKQQTVRKVAAGGREWETVTLQRPSLEEPGKGGPRNRSGNRGGKIDPTNVSDMPGGRRDRCRYLARRRPLGIIGLLSVFCVSVA